MSLLLDLYARQQAAASPTSLPRVVAPEPGWQLHAGPLGTIPTLTPPKAHGVLGFFGNLVADAANIGGGLVNLVLGPTTDVAKLGVEALVPGSQHFKYFTPELPKMLYEIPKGMVDRWVMPIVHLSPSELLNKFYEHPGMYVADYLAAEAAVTKVGEVGAVGAAVPKPVAAVITKFGEDSAAGRLVTQGLRDAVARQIETGRIRNVEPATAAELTAEQALQALKGTRTPIMVSGPLYEPWAKALEAQRAGEAASTTGRVLDWLIRPEQGTLTAVRPKGSLEAMVREIRPAHSALVRNAIQGPLAAGEIFGRPLPGIFQDMRLGDIADAIAERQARLETMRPDSAEYGDVARQIEDLQAAMDAGATKIYSDWRTTMSNKSAMNLILGRHQTAFLNARGELVTTLKPLMDQFAEAGVGPKDFVDIMTGRYKGKIPEMGIEKADAYAKSAGYDSLRHANEVAAQMAAGPPVVDPTLQRLLAASRKAGNLPNPVDARIAEMVGQGLLPDRASRMAMVDLLPGLDADQKTLAKMALDRAALFFHDRQGTPEAMQAELDATAARLAALGIDEAAANKLVESIPRQEPLAQEVPRRIPSTAGSIAVGDSLWRGDGLHRVAEVAKAKGRIEIVLDDGSRIEMKPDRAVELGPVGGEVKVRKIEPTPIPAEVPPAEAARIGVTGFRVDEAGKGDSTTPLTKIADVEAWRKSEHAQEFVADMRSLADETGVTVDSAPETIGIWDGTLEPSWQPQVRGDGPVVLEYAARLGKKHDQDGVLVFEPGAGPDVTIEFPVKNRRAAIKAMDETGVLGATFDGKRLQVTSITHLGEDSTAEVTRAKVTALRQRLGVPDAAVKETSGKSYLLDRGDYDQAIQEGQAHRGIAGELPADASRRLAGAPGEAAATEAGRGPPDLREARDLAIRKRYLEDRLADPEAAANRYFRQLTIDSVDSIVRERQNVARTLVQDLLDGLNGDTSNLEQRTNPIARRIQQILKEIEALDAKSRGGKAREAVAAEIEAAGGYERARSEFFNADGTIRKDLSKAEKETLKWYRKSGPAVLTAIFGDVIPVRLGDGSSIPAGELLANLLAATSSNIAPKGNFQLALSILHEYLGGTKPEAIRSALGKVGGPADELGRIKGGLPDSFEMAAEVLNGKTIDLWPDELIRQRTKIVSFYGNLMGEWDHATMDSWMRRYILDDPTLTPAGGAVLKSGEFSAATIRYFKEQQDTVLRLTREINDAIAREGESSAKLFGLRRVRAADVQAFLWVKEKEAFADFLQKGASDLNRQLAGEPVSVSQQAKLANYLAERDATDTKKRLPGETKGQARARFREEYKRILSRRGSKAAKQELVGRMHREAGSARETNASFGDWAKSEAFAPLIDAVTKRLEDRTSYEQAAKAEILGQIQFGPGFTRVIRLANSGDIVTFVHEVAHDLRRVMSPEEQQLFADVYAGRGIKVFNKDGSWSVAAEEAFARDAEAWWTGKVAEARAKPLFERLHAYIVDRWHQIRPDIEDYRAALSREQQRVFESMLGDPNAETVGPHYPSAAVVDIPMEDLSGGVMPEASDMAPDRSNYSSFADPLRAGRTGHLRGTVQILGNGKLEARVHIGSWNDVATELQRIADAGLEILGRQDTRGKGGDLGERGVRIAVRTPNGDIGHVELVTPYTDQLTSLNDVPLRVWERHQRELADARAQLESGLNQDGEPLTAGETAALQEHISSLEIIAEDANNYMRDRWAAVARQVRQDVLGEKIPPEQAVMDNFALWVYRWIENPTLERFGDKASLSEMAARTYLMEMTRDGAHWKKVEGPDGEPNYVWESPDNAPAPDFRQLRQARIDRGDVLPLYFPGVKEMEGGLRGEEWLLSRKAIGARKRTATVLGRYMRKATGERFAEGTFEKNNIEGVYQARAMAALKHMETSRLINDVVNTFGREVQKYDDVNLKSEGLVAPDYLNRFFRVKAGLTDQIMMKVAEALANDYGTADLVDDIYGIIDEAARASQQEFLAVTSRGMKLYAVPKEVLNRLEGHYRSTFGEDLARMFWDPPHKVWRNMVLLGSPRWIVNNLVGNILFGFMQGAHLSDVIRQLRFRDWELDPQFLNYLEDIMPAEARAAVNQGFFRSEDAASVAPNMGTVGESGMGRAVSRFYERARQTPGMGFARTYGEAIRGMNTAMENAFRSASYSRAAERAMMDQAHSVFRRFWMTKEDMQNVIRSGLDDAKVKRLIDEVNHFYNDYNALGPIERTVVRRYFVPFYSFYKHIVNLLVRYPFEYPGKWWMMAQVAQHNDEMEKEIGLLPNWLQGAMPLTTVEPGRETPFLMTAGPNPFNMISQTPLSLLDPVWKIGLENMLGRNTFTGKEFTDPNVVEDYSGKRFRVLRDPQGHVIAMEPVEKVTVNPLEAALSQLPQYQLLEDVLGGGKSYDTQMLPGILADRLSGQPNPLSYQGQPVAPMSLPTALLKYAGVNVIPYDVSAYQEAQQRNALAAYKTMLRQQQKSGG